MRWSQNSTVDNQRFLYVDVAGKSLRLCRVQQFKTGKVEYETISTHTKVPSFRAFDWSASNEALVAVGQSSGEATVLELTMDRKISSHFRSATRDSATLLRSVRRICLPRGLTESEMTSV